MRLDSWPNLEQALATIAEGGNVDERAARQLAELGLVLGNSEAWHLVEHGERYYVARFVAEDAEAAKQALGSALQDHPIGGGFCEAVWALGGSVPKDGAVRLLKRLLQSSDDQAAKRWLTVLNNAGLIAYNRANPQVRVLWHPGSLDDADQGDDGSGQRAHVISPSTPYQNVLSLREVIRGAKDWLWWFEIHMPPKALEVLHKEVAAGQVSEVRLLSGPANITRDLQGDFKRARKEWSSRRGIAAEWRVINKKLSRDHHDRLFLSAAGAYNVPPINTILQGSTSEILPSNLTAEDFKSWWNMGDDLLGLQLS